MPYPHTDFIAEAEYLGPALQHVLFIIFLLAGREPTVEIGYALCQRLDICRYVLIDQLSELAEQPLPWVLISSPRSKEKRVILTAPF